MQFYGQFEVNLVKSNQNFKPLINRTKSYSNFSQSRGLTYKYGWQSQPVPVDTSSVNRFRTIFSKYRTVSDDIFKILVRIGKISIRINQNHGWKSPLRLTAKIDTLRHHITVCSHRNMLRRDFFLFYFAAKISKKFRIVLKC